MPSATIGGLSLILAGGLELLGFIKRVNAEITQTLALNALETFPKHLPDWLIWLAAGLFAAALASAILCTPGQGRRLLLFITTLILVGTWAPVLSLAAHAPAIAAPWIATLWSGICALVYATNHRMACDTHTSSNITHPPASPDDSR